MAPGVSSVSNSVSKNGIINKTTRKDDKKTSEDDPYDVLKIKQDKEYEPYFSELTTCGKVRRVLWDWIGKLLIVVGCLYLFICSIDLLSSAFRLLAGNLTNKYIWST